MLSERGARIFYVVFCLVVGFLFWIVFGLLARPPIEALGQWLDGMFMPGTALLLLAGVFAIWYAPDAIRYLRKASKTR